MRCLRSITDIQQLAHVYLSMDNYNILDDELKKNFNIDIKEVTSKNADFKQDYMIHIMSPVKTLSLEEIKRTYELLEKEITSAFKFDTSKIDIDKYKSRKIVKKGLDYRFSATETQFVSDENRPYSFYSVIFEISKYLNVSPIKIEGILEGCSNCNEIVNLVSDYNELLYDELIPAIFNYLYDLKEKTETKEKTVPLIRYPKGYDHFVFRSTEKLTIEKNDPLVRKYSSKSFHTDRYCFDSEPEKKLFIDLLESDEVEEVYFTGMFTGSENGLSVQYIDPESNLIRNYYPDILVYYKDGSIEIIEVKGDNKIDDRVVEAKAFAALDLAEHSKMDYDMVASSTIMNGQYKIKPKCKN